ncbi:DUF2513 domain-containing protein [Psychrobacillus sp. FSL H8-0483]|uniref:DUF2513 domain-containing protein n=1 Tax=Psychrobacillus sp. FSL H8-0483 TaxID=2921389 RepID=UPI00315B39B6
MRRDMELVRKILIDTADGVDSYNLQLGRFADADVEKVRKDEMLIYHINIMSQKKLINFKHLEDLDGDCRIYKVELSWDGQDYLSTVEDDTIWNKTKDVAKARGLEIAKISFDVVKNLAVQQSKQLLGIE